jgi:hypothetical protein
MAAPLRLPAALFPLLVIGGGIEVEVGLPEPLTCEPPDGPLA